MKQRVLLVLVVLNSILAAEDSLPFEGLTADSLARREEAQIKISQWAFAHPVEARKRLLNRYLKSDDPELRRRLLPALEHAYFPQKGYVGVQMISGQFDRLGNLRRPGEKEETDGVLVVLVAPGTPAEASGLKPGDVILKINDWKVEGEDRVSATAREIQKNQPGMRVGLSIRREREVIDLTLILGILPLPSERARLQRESEVGGGLVSDEVREQLEEFRQWLLSEIEEERKNLIADRR